MEHLTPEEAALFEAFRVLRERVFEGSDAFRERVIQRVEQEVEGRPAEPLGVALVVHAVNFLASLFTPPPDEDGSPRAPAQGAAKDEADAAKEDPEDPRR